MFDVCQPLLQSNMNPNASQSPLCNEMDYFIDRKALQDKEWVFFGILLTLSLGICLGNGLIIAAFIRIWKLHVLTLSNYLILQLTLADFTLGCGLLYNAVTTKLRKPVLNHNLCALRHAIHLFPGIASLVGMFVITCNRYIAIVHHPLTYQVTPSRRYYVIYTLIIWIPPAILGFLLPMMWHNHCPAQCAFDLTLTTSYLKYVFILLFVLLAFLMTALYSHILVTTKNRMRNISHSTGQPRDPQSQAQEGVYNKRKMMIIKACLLLFATFYASWLPFLVILGIQLYSGQLEHDSPMTMAQYFSMLLVPINSLANPVIYGYRLPDLKSEISMMLLNWRKRLSCRQNNN